MGFYDYNNDNPPRLLGDPPRRRRRQRQSLDQNGEGSIQSLSREKKLLISTSTNTRDAACGEYLSNRTFVTLKDCSVHLCKLDVTVHTAKHPTLQRFFHGTLVREMRLALEKALEQAIVDMFNTINAGADRIMGLTDQGLECLREDKDLPRSGRLATLMRQQPGSLEPANNTGARSDAPSSSH
ncbi:hypothetical protein BGX26_003137 [Mortierella sp. AD094]|nr:hypothetical protein BGX26_003137 [Mortierella sp. AD094]